MPRSSLTNGRRRGLLVWQLVVLLLLLLVVVIIGYRVYRARAHTSSPTASGAPVSVATGRPIARDR